MIVRKMALLGAVSTILCGIAAQASHATLVPRAVFAEEFGFLS